MTPAIARIPNRIGTGTIWFRVDHELVGKTLAEKLRRKAASRGDCDAIRHQVPERGLRQHLQESAK